MKLYCHYKNKPYKFLGLARHSETLEELALYETLYKNDLGKIWVRPKAMFFEEVVIDNKKQPRFAEVEVKVQAFEKVEGEQKKVLIELSKKIFGNWDETKFQERLVGRRSCLLLLLEVGGQAAGYKLGYELDEIKFYSWVGGVLPEFRGLGLAAKLMGAQHVWAKAKGYKIIETKSQNKFRHMIGLNLKFGFDITGCNWDDSGTGNKEMKVIMEKRLS